MEGQAVPKDAVGVASVVRGIFIFCPPQVAYDAPLSPLLVTVWPTLKCTRTRNVLC
jgi:hypothetical protein